jgi:NPCBM/NEW2 domain
MNHSFQISALALRILCACFLAAGTFAVAEDEVEQLQAAFEKRHDAAKIQRNEQLEKLETGYLAALNRHLEKVQASGKLEDVLSIRDEIEIVKKGTDPLPALPATATYDFKQLRKTYTEARAAIGKTHDSALSDLATKLIETLKAKEVQFTKAGKIDQALAAKKLRESIEQDEEIAVALPAGKPEKEGGADGWIPIKKAEMKIVNQSQYPVKWIDEQYRPTVTPAVAKHIDAAGADENSLMTVAPASVQVTFKSPVTRFRCKVMLADEGDAKFVISAGGKIVQSFDLKGAGKKKDIDVRLPQSRELVLAVEINGKQHGDWAVWMNPEAR